MLPREILKKLFWKRMPTNGIEMTEMSRNAGKRTLTCAPSENHQISLRFRKSESLLGLFWIAKDATFLNEDNEGSDQTARMRRLIWIFVEHTCKKERFRPLWLMSLV